MMWETSEYPSGLLQAVSWHTLQDPGDIDSQFERSRATQGHHLKALIASMCQYEQAPCCRDKLQHAPALEEHALILHVQLIIIIFTVR